MDVIEISEEEYLDFIYDSADGNDTLSAAFEGAYINLKATYGRHSDLDLPYISKASAERLYKWCREVGVIVDTEA